jgi:hypothetical protein
LSSTSELFIGMSGKVQLAVVGIEPTLVVDESVYSSPCSSRCPRHRPHSVYR